MTKRNNAKVTKSWEPDQTFIEDFHRYLLEQKIPFTEAEFAQNQDWIKLELRREMFSSALSIDDARRLTIQTDPEVARAIDSMPKARALLDNVKRVMAQRIAKPN